MYVRACVCVRMRVCVIGRVNNMRICTVNTYALSSNRIDTERSRTVQNSSKIRCFSYTFQNKTNQKRMLEKMLQKSHSKICFFPSVFGLKYVFKAEEEILRQV